MTRIRPRDDDRGAALVTVLFVGAALMALGLTASTVSTTNLINSGRDRLGTSALATGESGVAQAIQLMKRQSISSLACSTATTNCAVDPTTGRSLGNKEFPVTVDLPDGGTADVWVESVAPYNPSAGVKIGTYRIHSTGRTGDGKRTLEVDVTAEPFPFPIGLFTESNANFGGNGDVVTTSMFSKACIDSRDKIDFDGTDAFYGTPAGANSTTYITNKNDNNCGDGSSSSQGIHASGPCQTNFGARHDRDSQGGNIASTACLTGTGSSKFTINDLVAETGYVNKGLTPGQYAQLESLARASNHYFPSPSFVWPCYPAANCPAGQAPELNPVIYVNGDVDKPPLDNYKWIPRTGPTDCRTQPSVIMVVRNGDFTLNGGRSYAGNFFVPDGPSKGFVKATGGGVIYGTMFAHNLKFTGGGHFELHPCQIADFPSPLMDIQASRFREVDR